MSHYTEAEQRARFKFDCTCPTCRKVYNEMAQAARVQHSRVGTGADAVGSKFDEGKPPVELIDASFVDGLARVLAFGAKKYAADNWRNGISLRRLLGSTLRHVWALAGGEDNDQETGMSHALHAACQLMFYYWMTTNKPEMDDRWKSTK